MRGPPPKPTALKRVQGTYRRDRAARNEPRPPPGLPPCPRDLSPVARREYRRLGKQLLASGLMTEVDRPMLANLAAIWARWLAAERELERSGVVVRSPTGYPVTSPFLHVANACLKQLRLLLSEFGCSPASRTRISVAEMEKLDDPFEAYLSAPLDDDAADDDDGDVGRLN
jgi:P27 family predicted phage terminase small subunit